MKRIGAAENLAFVYVVVIVTLSSYPKIATSLSIPSRQSHRPPYLHQKNNDFITITRLRRRHDHVRHRNSKVATRVYSITGDRFPTTTAATTTRIATSTSSASTATTRSELEPPRSVQDLEPYIIGSVFVTTAFRSALDRLLEKDEYEDDDNGDDGVGIGKNDGTYLKARKISLEEIVVEKQEEGDIVDVKEKSEHSLTTLASVATSITTVIASIILPFFDLDAALVVAEYTPFIPQMEFIAEIPSLAEVELIDDAFDFEDVLLEGKIASNKNDSKDDDDDDRAHQIKRSSDGGIDLNLPKRAAALSASLVVGVLGTTLAKARETQQKLANQNDSNK